MPSQICGHFIVAHCACSVVLTAQLKVNDDGQRSWVLYQTTESWTQKDMRSCQQPAVRQVFCAHEQTEQIPLSHQLLTWRAQEWPLFTECINSGLVTGR